MSGKAFDSSIEDLTETGLADDFRTLSDVRPLTGAFNDSLSEGTQRFLDALSSGADYFEIDDVDKVDDFYDRVRFKSFGEAQFSDNEYFSQTQSPEYLRKFFDNRFTGDKISPDDALNIISGLNTTEELEAALSDHYGYEITASEQNLGKFGGNLAAHTSSSQEQLAQFHSLIEPILSEQVSYLQAVKGLTYQDALQEAYKQDPMLQAMYSKYGVSPLRQTDDGSTYLYDPFTFGEIRTLEVKDPTAGDIAKQIGISIALGAALGPAAAKVAGTLAPGASAAAQGVLAKSITGAASTALQGGDLEASLKSGLLSAGVQFATDKFKAIKDGTVKIKAAPGTDAAGTIDITADPSAFDGIDIDAVTPEVVGETLRQADNLVKAVPGMEDFTKDYVAKFGQDAYDKIAVPNTAASNAAFKNALLEYSKPLHDEFFDEVLTGGGFITDTPSTFQQAFDKLGPAVLRSPLNLTPSQLREIPVTEAYDTSGNLLTDSTTPADMEFTSYRFGDPPPTTATIDPQNVAYVRPTVQQSFFEQAPGGGGGAPAFEAIPIQAMSPMAGGGLLSLSPSVVIPDFTVPGSVSSTFLSDFMSATANTYLANQARAITPIATTRSQPVMQTTTDPTSDVLATAALTTTTDPETGASTPSGTPQQGETGGGETEAGTSGGSAGDTGLEGQGTDAGAPDPGAGQGVGQQSSQTGAGQGGTGTGQGVGSGSGTGGQGAGQGDGGEGDGPGGMGGGFGMGGGMEDFLGQYQIPGFNPADASQAYTPPGTMLSLGENIANEIRNLRSFGALTPQQVNNRLSTLGNPLLQQIVNERLYGGGQR